MCIVSLLFFKQKQLYLNFTGLFQQRVFGGRKRAFVLIGDIVCACRTASASARTSNLSLFVLRNHHPNMAIFNARLPIEVVKILRQRILLYV